MSADARPRLRSRKSSRAAGASDGRIAATARARTAREVFADHLRCRSAHAVEEDIARNYAADVILLTGFGLFREHDGVRRLARLLDEQLPCATYDYRTQLVNGELAFLEWAARCPTASVEDGADSFVIKDGRIVAQTIHYTPRRADADGSPSRGHGTRKRETRRRSSGKHAPPGRGGEP